jgi:hypothetical protein
MDDRKSKLQLSPVPSGIGDDVEDFLGMKQICELPLKCYETVEDAHKNNLTSAQRHELIDAFRAERNAVYEIIKTHIDICKDIDREERLKYFRDYEEKLDYLEEFFKQRLFEDNLHCDHRDFSNLSFKFINLLDRLKIMIELTTDDFKGKAWFLEKIREVPVGTSTSIEEFEQNEKELDKFENDAKEVIQKIEAKTKEYYDSKKKKTKLTDTESCILESLGQDSLNGRELLKKTGYDNSSHYRQILSNLVKRNVLGKNVKGYFAEKHQ